MQYEYAMQSFDPEGTVEIPDAAEGITTETFGGEVFVRYLIPVEVDA